MNEAEKKIFEIYMDGSMKIFKHHIYEYKKGLRDLILHTCHVRFKDDIVRLLEKHGVTYLIKPVGDKKLNVFFGNEACIHVLDKINKDRFSSYTDEEDFILGIMLGYNRLQQCERYLKRKKNCGTIEELIG